jgi:hypothetical protein
MITISAALLFALLIPASVAQASPPPEPPPIVTAPPSTMAPTQIPTDDAATLLNNGPCLDSPASVPHVLQEPVVREMQIVRIDRVISTYSMTPDEVIGFVYVTRDGTHWLGQRTSDYMSAANARQINHVLVSARLSHDEPQAFPPTTHLGFPVHTEQYYRVDIPPAAWGPLHIRLQPCVAWPSDRPLPDPSL